MTEREDTWFELLTSDREESAAALEKPSMRGVQRSVVDKYSDQAHFIYELLQNADDAGATSASFRLERNGLYFQHNGTVHFSISDPTREEEDTKEGSLGHINAITSLFLSCLKTPKTKPTKRTKNPNLQQKSEATFTEKNLRGRIKS